ncbi:hypothetical protein Taro_053457 [Colocasia esculenta]|uniref:BED-type domain-containing protein n=1 Tax=Colocasia esculenta TaxID=4460 RepID=A0A843XN43_COLES|nr:hypothetical protein [Colocasia esculenta]
MNLSHRIDPYRVESVDPASIRPDKGLASMADEGHEEEHPQVDIGWKHGVLIDAASKRVRCNHCGKEMNGGVYRLKQHIADIGTNNIREAEEKDKGMDKGDMKDNNIMQPMSGHLGSQTIVQGLLIYLHFSLSFYRTQILVAHLMEYKEDGDLGLHKNKSLVALVKQQVHTNRLVYGVQLHHNLEKAQVNNLHQEGFKWLEELSKDDYFLKNNEFSTWLKEEKGMFFSELSSETARELFSKFVKDWNGGKLQPRYYEGIASGPRTGHDWKIKT